MSNMSKFSIKKPVTVLMGVLIIIILGVISFVNITTDLFPSMNLPYAIVSTTYIGGSPEEVEATVTKPIESSMATVSNIKNINSVSQENVSMVILEFNETANMDSVMVEMRESLDMILSLMPDEVGNPVIMKLNPDMMPIMEFSISLPDKTISESTAIFNDEIMPILESTEGIANIELYGASEDEIHVTLNDEKIATLDKQYGGFITRSGVATEDTIKNILAGQNFEMPAGYINDENVNYLVRIGDKFKTMDEIKELPIMSTSSINITLEDIADIEVVNINDEEYTKVDGKDAIIITAQKQNSYATTDVVKNLEAKIELVKEQYPNAEVKVIMDQAEYINMAVGSVGTNLVYGGILAILILFIFLRDIKPTFVIGLAIPISIMAAFIMIYFFGITINIVSLGGLALGIGMLVDNSVVVIENIYRLRNKGMGAVQAAIKGSKGVAGAITASTLTTISVFIPILFLQGWTAEIFKELALTITFSLIASLVIALTLVPMMSAQVLKKDYDVKKHKILEKIKTFYKKTLKYTIKHKAISVVTIIVLFIGSIIGSLSIGTEFIPASDSKQITVSVNMPKGSDYSTTEKEMEEVTKIIETVKEVETTAGLIGNANPMMPMLNSGGTIYVLLDDNIKKTTQEVAQEIRNLVVDRESDIAVEDDAANMSMMFSSGIAVTIKGTELDQLEELANKVTKIVEEAKGTTEIDNGISQVSPELKITLDRTKSIGSSLTNAQVFVALAEQINVDKTASSISINGRNYDINVYSGNEEEVTVEDITNTTITNPLKQNIDLTDIATIEKDYGFGVINRENQTRTITVTSSIEEGFNIGLVSKAIEKEIDKLEIPSGYQVIMAGEQAETGSSMNALLYALLLSVVLIYMIMAAQFESLLYPFIVMFTIPLAFTGSFLGLFITGTPLSIVAFIGIIVLTGVVVNNGIVLVDYINRLKKDGMKTKDAVMEAGVTRLRPILMTALTTILALSTMAFGLGDGAEMMQPMAITAIGGLIFATVLTLYIVPVVYAGIDKIKYRKKGKKKKKRKSKK